MDDTINMDLANLSEDQIVQMAVYVVPDQPVEPNSQKSPAKQTLPRNLALKESKTKTSVSNFYISFLNLSLKLFYSLVYFDLIILINPDITCMHSI